MKRKALFLIMIISIFSLTGYTQNEEPSEESTGEFISYYDSITGDMLDDCNTLPSLDAYENDALVLLNWYNDDVRLYGINTDNKSAMLLYVDGNHTGNLFEKFSSISSNCTDIRCPLRKWGI